MLLAGLDLLACPRCTAELELDRQLTCAAGHAFDVARQGYVNLSDRPPPRNADTAAMVAARMAFLTGGHYDAVADAAVACVPDDVSTVLDAGAGTGFYATRLLAARASARGVALDVSVPAIRRAARAHPRLAAAVADVWRPLPVREAVIDVVLSVFAPRNVDEFARVLRPGGSLVTLTPAPAHLAELRAELQLLDHQDDKADRLARTLGDSFRLEQQLPVAFVARWDAGTARDCVLMGPNAFHVAPAELDRRLDRLTWPRPVSVSVAVQSWRLA